MLREKLFNFRPLVFLAISILLGILSAYCFAFSQVVLAVFFLALFFLEISLLVFVSIKTKNLRYYLVFSVIFILLFLSGFILFNITLTNYEKADKNDHYYKVTGRVEQIAIYDDYSKALIGDVYLEGVKGGESKYKIQLYISDKGDLEVGDEVDFSTYLTDRSAIYDGKFSAQSVFKKIKYNASVSFSEIEIVGNRKTLFEWCNLKIRDSLKDGLSEDSFSVAYALLTGDSSFMDEEVLENFRLAGVNHIFAVSGLHIGFLAVFLSLVFSKIKINRYLKAFIIGIVLFFYSGVCGFSASSIRASVMTVVLLFSRCFGERYDGLSSISFSFVLVLLLSPIQLFSAGFILSFSIVFGLILLSRPFSKALKFLPEKIRTSFSSCLIAFLIGSPIMIIFFGQFSLFGIIANFLLLPVIGVVYILTFVSTLLSAFTTLSFFLFPSELIFKLLIFLIGIIDYKVFIIGGFVLGGGVCLYYLFLLCLSDVINLRKIVRRIIVVTLMVSFILSSIITNVNYNRQTRVYLSGSNTFSFSLIAKGEDESLIIHDVNYICSTNNLERLVNKLSIKDLERVIILSSDGKTDFQVLITKLNYLFDSIDSVYYCGERDYQMEKVMNNSFPSVKVYNLFEYSKVDLEGYTFEFIGDGNLLRVYNEEVVSLFFGKIGDKGKMPFFTEEKVDFLIGYDKVDNLSAYYLPKKTISVRKGSIYENGENSGFLIFNFK